MNENPYMTLAKFILPSEMTDYFDLIKVKLDQFGEEQRLHLYLDEKDIVSTTFLYASIVQYSMCVVADGRTQKARVYRKIGRWLPKEPATRRSLRLF